MKNLFSIVLFFMLASNCFSQSKELSELTYKFCDCLDRSSKETGVNGSEDLVTPCMSRLANESSFDSLRFRYARKNLKMIALYPVQTNAGIITKVMKDILDGALFKCEFLTKTIDEFAKSNQTMKLSLDSICDCFQNSLKERKSPGDKITDCLIANGSGIYGLFTNMTKDQKGKYMEDMSHYFLKVCVPYNDLFFQTVFNGQNSVLKEKENKNIGNWKKTGALWMDYLELDMQKEFKNYLDTDRVKISTQYKDSIQLLINDLMKIKGKAEREVVSYKYGNSSNVSASYFSKPEHTIENEIYHVDFILSSYLPEAKIIRIDFKNAQQIKEETKKWEKYKDLPPPSVPPPPPPPRMEDLTF